MIDLDTCKKNKKGFTLFVFLILLLVSKLNAQERNIQFGITMGTCVVPNTLSNITTFGKEIGLSINFKANRHFEFQTNFFYCRKNLKVIAAKYKTDNVSGYQFYKPVYSVFENALLINYILKVKNNGVIIKLIGGACLNNNELIKFKFGGRAWKGRLDTFEDISNIGEGGQNLTSSLMIGLSLNKKFKQKNIYYSWTLIYQKALNRAPTFHIAGNIYFNGYDKNPFNITVTPFLDALSLRYTFYFYDLKLK